MCYYKVNQRTYDTNMDQIYSHGNAFVENVVKKNFGIILLK